MSKHLLLITLGPVQGFIAQARRTRDLWFGSHLLSELSRRAAREMAKSGAELVFPSMSRDDPELENCFAAVRPDKDGKPPLNVANKLLAEVPDGTDPAGLARDVRKAVNRFWSDFAREVQKNCAGLIAPDSDPTWDEQVETFIEFSAAWTPMGDYKASFDLVEQAIASRKKLRDFTPWVRQRGRLPKSSLDGARETVLRPPEKRTPGLVTKFRISAGEQLDAIGLVKRAGGRPEQFLPLANVALSSWIGKACEVAPGEMKRLKEACRLAGMPRIDRSDLPCVADFPFDASVMLESRWKVLFEEAGITQDPIAWGMENVEPLFRRMSKPWPYVACIVADGDRMGRAIEHMTSAQNHRDFSKMLSEFAGIARHLVEKKHRGSLIYAGGDDVLAFLPVTNAVSCADDLRREFAEIMGKASNMAGKDWQNPTLSVGLGIGHLSENMGDLLALGREAERSAKLERNSLSVLIDKRSGGRRSWRCSWDCKPSARLMDDASLLDERLSTRKVYDISRTLKRLPIPGSIDDPAWSRILSMEVERSLSRTGEGSLNPGEAGLQIDGSMSYTEVYDSVLAWVDRMLIAGMIASANPVVLSRSGGEE